MRKKTLQAHWIPLFLTAILSSLTGAIIVRSGQQSPTHDDDSSIEHGLDTSFVSPELEPENVVRLQVEAMRNAMTNPDSMITCYSLASPSNRMMTGPYENFCAMVNEPPYNQLMLADDWQIGSPQIEGRDATIMVSTLSSDGQAAAFRFYMHRQDEPPLRDCWLTDAVIALDEISN